MNIRIFVVVTGVNVNLRHTRLFAVTAAPGMFTQAAPSQYCTWNARKPNDVNVIVGVGSTGAV